MSKRSPNKKPQRFDAAAVTKKLRGNAKRLRFAFSEVRRDTPPQFYDELARYRSNAFYRLKIFGDPFPITPAQIKRVQPLQALGTKEEILWAESSLKQYAKEISAFIEFQNDVSESVGRNDYNTALKTLDKLESQLGLSIWSYAMRFVIGGKSQGVEDNSDIYASLRTTAGVNGFTYYIIFYLGFRTSPGSTVQHLREEVPDSSTVYDSLSMYIANKLAPFHFNKVDSTAGVAAAIIRHDTNSSAIDLYRSYHRALAVAVSEGEVSSSLAAKSAARLHKVVPDKRSLTIAQFGKAAPIEFDHQTALVLDALDLIYGGRIDDEDVPFDRLLRLLGWTAEDPDTIAGIIRSSVEKLASKSQGRFQAAEQLEKVCTSTSELDASHSAFSIGRRLWVGGSAFSIFGTLDGALSTAVLVPDLAEFMESEVEGLEYLVGLETLYGVRPSISAFKGLLSGRSSGLSSSATTFVEALSLARKGEEAEAMQRLSALDGKSSPLWQALPLRVSLSLSLGQLDDAVRLIALACVDDEDAWASLPIQDVVEAVMLSGGTTASVLEWAIVLDVATANIDQKYARHRSYAVEDTWESRGLCAPSAIVATLSNSEYELGCYYLHRLCTSDVLSDSDQFQTVRDLEEERIRVCQALVELDSKNADAYLSEIKALTRWLVIYDGLRSVEQSKIHVDIVGLKSFLIPAVGPEYDRMMALRREKNALGNVGEIIKQDIVTYRDDELTGNLQFRYAFDDPSKILPHILAVISHEYASNSRYGLDVYLSTRIRHGTLKGHLRSPLEDNHVICQRSGADYKDNPHWISRSEELSEASETAFYSALKSFSSQIDENISELNGKYLRLYSNENPSGWFNTSLRERDSRIINDFLTEHHISFPEFLDMVLDILNARLQYSLANVQRALQTSVREQWVVGLRGLREAAQSVSSSQLRNEIDAAIASAQVASDIANQRVSGWFTLSTAKENPDYTIVLAIDIAAKSVENCFGSNVLAIGTIEGDDPFLKGATLASLVDVFFILFENIAKHARSAQAATADISIVQSDRYYTITVRNDLPEEIDRAALSLRIQNITDSLSSENSDRLVTEGGTGYHKLRKIIGYDLGLDHDFEFGIQGNRYEVIIVLDVSAVMA